MARPAWWWGAFGGVAPLENLGLIVVDEEQEHAYKSERAPRYHAREVALYRGYRQRALVVLGSATPSMESMYHAQKGDYSLYRLTRRYNGKALPEVRLADMKEELRAGNSSVISAPLEASLRRCLEEGRQAILLLNRRGRAAAWCAWTAAKRPNARVAASI